VTFAGYSDDGAPVFTATKVIKRYPHRMPTASRRRTRTRGRHEARPATRRSRSSCKSGSDPPGDSDLAEPPRPAGGPKPATLCFACLTAVERGATVEAIS
jgi:hypothetical protein